MLRQRRKIRFSCLELLERVWLKKRVRWTDMEKFYPLTSGSTLSLNVNALTRAGLLSRRRIAVKGARAGPGPRWCYWRPTARGRAVLCVLGAYRDYWEALQLREIAAVAAAEAVKDKLDRMHQDIFGPDGPPLRKDSNYFARRSPAY